MTRARAAAVCALLLTLTGCAADANPPAATTTGPVTRTVTGTLMLDDPSGFAWHSTTGCSGTGGYNDVSPGAQVIVTDSTGATVGLGKLSTGILETAPGATAADGCKFSFIVQDVPTGKGFYGVEVAHRGSVQYPEQQLFGALSLTLG
ncbi:hypothetical protein ACFY3B_19360 [Micromonospora parva]|uniref:Lipoprotein n=1 Tax=Micromonospora parva TaxID=1464048 RepID=A0ABW6VXY9_9ACTN